MHQNNTESFELESQYSTTRCVMRTPPVIVNNSEDKFESVLFLPKNSERKAEGGLRTQGYFKHTQTDKPLISVITVVFNGEQYLEQTINSVIGQTYDNVEYIIIDGGSTDGTLDIIRRYEGAIDYWVSEGDEGISDAFNKGITLCSGEMIGIINADDWYEKKALLTIKEYIGKADVLYGDMNLLDDEEIKVTPKIDYKDLKQNMTICHPSCFINSSVYKKRFIYNTDFNYAMDYELLLKLYL
ncbi:MAG: glycosyltransferase family 2 protein, partial [Methyloprofundus sp.]|nr:glycosyltransferase family 2 protein [Methyloprofundus sp.]